MSIGSGRCCARALSSSLSMRRPIHGSRPIRLRFAGIKGKLLAAVSMAATAIVAFHDFILANAFGIDWTPVHDLLPAWAWPFILFADFWLISKFRQMTDRRQAQGL